MYSIFQTPVPGKVGRPDLGNYVFRLLLLPSFGQIWDRRLSLRLRMRSQNAGH